MRPITPLDVETIDLLGFVRRHRGKMLIAFGVGLFLTAAYLSLATRVYESEAKFYVRMGRESVTLDPTATTGQFMSVADTRESEVHAVEELLQSRTLAENVVDKFGPHVILGKDPNKPGLNLSGKLSFLNGLNLNPLRVYSLRDKAIRAFGQGLRVAAANKTSVVTVSYEADDPQVAFDVTKEIITAARDQHLDAHRTSGSQEFFVEQANLLKGNLTKLEEQYRDLKTKSGLSSLETQRELKLELLDSLEADLVKAEADEVAARAEVDHRRRSLVGMPELIVTERTTGLPQSTGQTLREKLYDLEVREKELAANLTDAHPLLAQVRGQLGEARAIAQSEKAGEQVTKGMNTAKQTGELAKQEREAELASFSARTKSLENTIAAQKAELKSLNDNEVEVKRLEREIELAQANYVKYSENLEQARINQELEDAQISSLNLLQPPSFSETPKNPKPLVTLAVGFVLSTFGAIGVALAAQIYDQRKQTSNHATGAQTNGVYSNGHHETASAVHLSERFSVPGNPR